MPLRPREPRCETDRDVKLHNRGRPPPQTYCCRCHRHDHSCVISSKCSLRLWVLGLRGTEFRRFLVAFRIHNSQITRLGISHRHCGGTPVGSPLLRRELLDTAVTRAHKHLVLIASEDAITSAVMNTINCESGLTTRVRS